MKDIRSGNIYSSDYPLSFGEGVGGEVTKKYFFNYLVCIINYFMFVPKLKDTP